MNFKHGHVVLLSGGADSATVLACAHMHVQEERGRGYDTHLVAFHCNYGQRTEERELECFHQLCDHYDVTERFVVDIGYLKQIGGSSLTDKAVSVENDGKSIVEGYVPTSYVPYRNGNLLSIAASIAAVKGSTDLWIGVVDEDSSGYPDCRASFIESAQAAINLGLPDGQDVLINTPILNKKKWEIIKAGLGLKVPYEKTWSCYQENEKACGECDSCRLRVASFAKIGEVDPIEYKYGWDAALAKAKEVIEVIES